MLYLLFTSYQIMWTLISLPLQMAERLRRVQPVAVANHVKARQSPIERAVTWLATATGWTRRKRSAICSGKHCGGFIIFDQCCPCGCKYNCWLELTSFSQHRLVVQRVLFGAIQISYLRKLCRYNLNNSMLCMRGRVFDAFFAVTSYSCNVTHNGFCHILAWVRKVNFWLP